MQARNISSLCIVLASGLWSLPALALSVEVADSTPSEVGVAHTFKATVQDASGTVKYEWRFADTGSLEPGSAEVTHTYTGPGHFTVDVKVTDGAGSTASTSFQHLVHYPLKAQRPTSATSIIYDKARNRVYSVNQDNDTVTSVDAGALKKVAELPVYRRPESLALTPQGKLWVVHQDDYAVAVIDPDKFTIERGFRLPYASQPVGVAMSPTGDAAYITLMAVGKLLKLNPNTGDLMGEVVVGPWARGLAVSHDGKDVYVTRFISPDAGGEVVLVDGPAMSVKSRILLAADKTTEDGPQAARGVPNYLFSVGLTPDGLQAWVSAKKDNIFRGQLRGEMNSLTHETTVRPLVSVIDVPSGKEAENKRIDLDDRSLPTHVEFATFGDFAIVPLFGSSRVEVRDVYRPTTVFSAIANAGAGPRATVVGSDKKLFVQAALSRNILVYDMAAIFDYFDTGTPPLLADIPAVSQEKLPADVLIGKKIFHFADGRMTSQGYLTCGACHFEGIDDGRVYDFSGRGEGLRNTPSLLGRAGMKQGNVDWTGNFDEIQDFEHQIREMFTGKGFIPNDVFNTGTRNQPLGEKKAGLSKDLDALAAYVSSLEHVNPSPFRNADGSMTGDGVAGRALFNKLGCNFCHAGTEMTDSPRGMLHDVGTITPNSGKRAGGPLTGIDTPTLLGVWETAPYLHDGSAATLRDVLTTKNKDDLHGFVSSLKPNEIDQLVSFMLQLDSELPARRLPFEPPLPAGSGGASGSGGAGAGTGSGGAVGTGATGTGGSMGASGGAGVTPNNPGACGCGLSPSARNGSVASALAALGLLMVFVSARRPRRSTCRRAADALRGAP